MNGAWLQPIRGRAGMLRGQLSSFVPAHYRKIMAAIRIAAVSESPYRRPDKRVNFDRKLKIRHEKRLKRFTSTD
ncbi:hypothetical protein Q7C36_022907 [Tachysurus vachellii]|uniref:Uncharacterized protein n=1 Tax=Tachysurus vachellii TaxID=175792 RepID=A0AA88IMC0_TACVA|nr:hypothetical protein Q7C36_022907 [Tachysurus vachellii]